MNSIYTGSKIPTANKPHRQKTKVKKIGISSLWKNFFFHPLLYHSFFKPFPSNRIIFVLPGFTIIKLGGKKIKKKSALYFIFHWQLKLLLGINNLVLVRPMYSF